jgi:hypothetical protein
MIRILKPIIMAFVRTNAVKKLIIDILEALAKRTDNTVDDKVVDYVKSHLWPDVTPTV